MPFRSLSILFLLTIGTLGVLHVRAQNHQASQSDSASEHSASSANPLILQEGDGEHRNRRPGGPTGSGSVSEFTIKIDKQNGNAEDFYVGSEVIKPGAMIPFNKHDNAEQVLIMEEGGATVTVGDKRAVAGPHSIVFIPRETWLSITNTGDSPIRLYALFSRQGFEKFLRARSVRPGEPLTPLTPEEVRRAEVEGHFTPWDNLKRPAPATRTFAIGRKHAQPIDSYTFDSPRGRRRAQNSPPRRTDRFRLSFGVHHQGR